MTVWTGSCSNGSMAKNKRKATKKELVKYQPKMVLPVRGDKVHTPEHRAYILNEAKLLIEHAKTAPIPSVASFVKNKPYGKNRLYQWSPDYPEIQEAIEFCKSCLEAKLIEGGLTNFYNSSMATFMLKAVCGYRDGAELAPKHNETKIMLIQQIEEGESTRIKLPSRRRVEISKSSTVQVPEVVHDTDS